MLVGRAIDAPWAWRDAAGDYVLTLTASQACSILADEARVPTYAAAITQTGTTITVDVTGSIGDVTNATTGGVRGDTVNLAVDPPRDPATRMFYSFALAGSGTGSLAENEITGTVKGVLQFAGPAFETWTCSATDHKFAFVRR